MATVRSTSTRNLKPTNISATQYSANVTSTYVDSAIYGVVTWGSFVYGYRGETLAETSLGQKMPRISTKEI